MATRRAFSAALRRRLELLWIALWLALFTLLAAYQLNLPGPHYDEAIEVLPAVSWLRGAAGEAFRNAGLHIGGRIYPLMVVDYIGALNTYLTYPIFRLFGIGVVQMRVIPILGGLCTLVGAYAVVRLWAGRVAAAPAILLLAVQPSFVFWSRQGIFVTSLTMPTLMALLWLLLRYRQKRQAGYLIGAAFLAGLGLWIKFLFLWPLLGLILCFGACLWIEGRRFTWPGKRTIALAGLVFLIGLAPLLIFNLQTGGTLLTFSANLSHSYYGVNNADYLSNLGQRFTQVREVMGGFEFWYLGGPFEDRLAWPLFGLAAVGALLASAGQGRARLLQIGLPLLLIGAIVLQSPLTPSALWHTHFAILVPLLPASLAINLATLTGSLATRWPRWAAPLLVVVTLGCAGGALRTDLQYHRALTASGGRAAHSVASLTLAQAIDGFNPSRVIALDWGISAPVALLTQGRHLPEELFGYGSLAQPGPDFGRDLTPLLADDTILYVFHNRSDYVVYGGRRAVFDAVVAAQGKQELVVIPITERDGTPIYDLLRVR